MYAGGMAPGEEPWDKQEPVLTFASSCVTESAAPPSNGSSECWSGVPGADADAWPSPYSPAGAPRVLLLPLEVCRLASLPGSPEAHMKQLTSSSSTRVSLAASPEGRLWRDGASRGLLGDCRTPRSIAGSAWGAAFPLARCAGEARALVVWWCKLVIVALPAEGREREHFSLSLSRPLGHTLVGLCKSHRRLCLQIKVKAVASRRAKRAPPRPLPPPLATLEVSRRVRRAPPQPQPPPPPPQAKLEESRKVRRAPPQLQPPPPPPPAKLGVSRRAKRVPLPPPPCPRQMRRRLRILRSLR